MSRIPYPDPETLSQPKRDVLNDPNIRTLNVSRFCMYVADPQWAAQRTLGIASARSLTIDPKLKEYVILRVAHLSGCDYELHHHQSIAANLGVGEDVFEALRVGDFSGFTPVERAVCQFVTELVQKVSPSDETLAAVRALISDELLFEIVFLAGYYMIIARVIAVGGPELDDEPVRAWT